MKFMPKAFVLTNHYVMQEQREDLFLNWNVSQIFELPADLKKAWAEIPPDAESVECFAAPVIAWLAENAAPADIVWVQGEWGVTALVLNWCRANGFCAIYSTTGRSAQEVRMAEGIRLTHLFRHVRFRKFPV